MTSALGYNVEIIMRRSTAVFFAIFLIFLSTELVAQQVRVEPGVVFFKTSASISTAASVQSLPAFKGKHVHTIEPLHRGISAKALGPQAYKVKVSDSEDIQAIVDALKKDPQIEWAQPNYIYQGSFVPNDPDFGTNQWNLPLIDMVRAWDLTLGSASVVIAVIDTGVDWGHPDLASKIWMNTDEIPGNNFDDDGNGKIDDIRGWDFVRASPSAVAPGEDAAPEDNNPIDFNRHGTHVAGIAAAHSDNNVGIAGVAPNCLIMAVRAGYSTGGIGGDFLSLDIMDALIYATDNGADIVNMSFGGSVPGGDFLVQAGVQYAAGNDVVLIGAAGNNFGLSIDAVNFIPAVYPEVIAVSAVGPGGVFATYSNTGASIEVAAPGGSGVQDSENIFSTIPLRFTVFYEFLAGTSMSAPHVAGLAALYKSLYPSATASEIRDAIRFGVTDLGAAGRDPQFGFGLVNATKLLAFPDVTPPVAIHEPILSGNPGSTIVISANITDNFGAPHSPSATLSYRFFNAGMPVGDWVTVAMSQAGDVFSSPVTIPGTNITDVSYYFTMTDLKPNTATLPSGGEASPFNIVVQDVFPPTISSTAIDGDFFDPDGSLRFTITDNVSVSANSIVLTVAGTPYPIGQNAFLSFAPPYSDRGFEPDYYTGDDKRFIPGGRRRSLSKRVDFATEFNPRYRCNRVGDFWPSRTWYANFEFSESV